MMRGYGSSSSMKVYQRGERRGALESSLKMRGVCSCIMYVLYSDGTILYIALPHGIQYVHILYEAVS